MYRSKSHTQHYPFPPSNSQGFQPWFSQISTQNLGHDIYPNQDYQNVGTNRIDWNKEEK